MLISGSVCSVNYKLLLLNDRPTDAGAVEKVSAQTLTPRGICQQSYTAGPMKLFVYSDVTQTRESPKSSQAGHYGRKVDKPCFTAPRPF